MKDKIVQAREGLSGKRSICVLTGAGISAESGIPTFRGKDGLWKNYRAEELATPYAFEKNPKLVWEWYSWRREIISRASPNEGHYAIAKMENVFPDFLLITQNVDGLHAAAGSKKMVELHGNIWRVKCTICYYKGEDRNVSVKYPPLCPNCEGLLRPDVVWFGEPLSPSVLSTAFEAVSRCEVMLVVGTSAVVQPAASLAWKAISSGAFTIEVNIEPTGLSDRVDVSLRGRAGDILPLLIE